VPGSKVLFLGVCQTVLVLLLSVLLSRLLVSPDPVMMGAALAGFALVATLLWYEKLSLPVMLATFFWAGMGIPFRNIAEIVRWIVLGVAAAAGLLVWVMARKPFRFGYLHLLAALCTTIFLLSYATSPNPTMTILKASSVGFLFLYGSFGGLLYIGSRERSFFVVAKLACETAVYAIAIFYIILADPVFGNPNSLGAIMAVVIWPFLFWDFLTIPKGPVWYRKLFAVILCAWILYNSLARAAFLAAAAATLFLLLAMRRKRMIFAFGVIALLGALVISTFRPADWNTLIAGVVYKRMTDTEVLESRRPRWQEASEEIQKAPWFGNGFGAAKDISETWAGGVATQGLNRERGSSYLTLVASVGFLGAVPAVLLLLLLLTKIWRTCKRVRLSGCALDPSIPTAALLLAGLCHVLFEDWLLATGYYLSVVFWILAFFLIDREDTARYQG